jgi:hypothetical protein
MDLLPGLPPAYATHVRLLTRCLRAVCCAGAPSPAWLFLLQDWLLQFLSAPTEWMHPPRFVWPQLARLAAQLLRGDPAGFSLWQGGAARRRRLYFAASRFGAEICDDVLGRQWNADDMHCGA